MPNRQLPVLHAVFDADDGCLQYAANYPEAAQQYIKYNALPGQKLESVAYPPPTQLRTFWRLLDDTELIRFGDEHYSRGGWIPVPENWIGKPFNFTATVIVIRRRETIAQTTRFSPWRPIAELDLNGTPRPVLIVAPECWPVIYWVPDRGDGTMHHELPRAPTHFCEIPPDPWDSDETIAQTEVARCETCENWRRHCCECVILNTGMPAWGYCHLHPANQEREGRG